jgi:hypothetical protein
MHMTRAEPPPAHCPLCNAFVGEVEPELSRVNIGGSDLSKSVDQVFAQSGMPDLKDGLRPGDIGAPTVHNVVTQTAAAMGHNFFQGNLAGMGAIDNQLKMARGDTGGAKAIETIQRARMGIL